MNVQRYLTIQGVDPVKKWLKGLHDSRGRIAIERRIDRMAAGNFGDHKFGRDGVWELRLDVGPGYRIYYSRQSDTSGGVGRRNEGNANGGYCRSRKTFG